MKGCDRRGKGRSEGYGLSIAYIHLWREIDDHCKRCRWHRRST